MEDFDDYDESEWDLISKHPYSKRRAELRIGKDQIDFVLPRRKRLREYHVVFTVHWEEIVAYDCSEIMFCKDDETWPIDDPLPDDYEPIGAAGIFFAFLRAEDKAYFQIWAIIPLEDIPRVRELVEKQLDRVSVPGLAHHGTTGAVNYVLDHCEVVYRIRLKWHDWIKRGPSTEPREKFQEINPELVICREGVAFNFMGASPKLKQMSTFWPWRLIREITVMHDEVPQIAYIWHEDSYTFTQQVWDDDERKDILAKLREVFQDYKSDDSIDEYVLIRPWSFPSRFHDTWDDLQPFVSKASRDGFPPILDVEEQTFE